MLDDGASGVRRVNVQDQQFCSFRESRPSAEAASLSISNRNESGLG